MNTKSNGKIPSLAAVLVFGVLVTALDAAAQSYSPLSLAGQAFTASVLSGSAPFSSNGNYMVFTSPFGSNFVILGEAEGGLNWGTYSYLKTGSNSGVATLVDAQSGLGVSVSLLYSSASGGQVTLSNSGETALQTASFAATSYASVVVPELFGATFSNGVFSASLSGQAGGVYSIQASPDLLNWSDAATLALSNTPGFFTFTNASGVTQFYRAFLTGVDLAPNAISGWSFNFTITQGGAPLASNSFLQFVADTSDLGYTATAGPVLTNLPGGTYTYAKFAPGAALLSSVDVNGVANDLNLVFTSAASGFFYATNPGQAGFAAGTFNTAFGPSLFLGNYRFTPDNSRSASLDFPASGNPASLSVTDALSNVWTLTLPADALFDSQMISMTPAASIDSSGAVLPAIAAVLLTPDGIQFSDGVTLTVTTPAPLGPQATLINAALDGSGLSLAPTTSQGNSYTTTLFHFSSAALSNPTGPQLQNLGTTAPSIVAAFNELASEAQTLVSRGVPPPPPDDYFCDTAKTSADGAAYLADVFGQEFDVIGQLLSTAAALNSLGYGSGNSYLTQAENLLVQIFTNDIFPRTTRLINTYGSDQNKLPVLCWVAVRIWKQAIQLGVAPSPPFLSAFESLPSRLEQAGNTILTQLSLGHDYSAASQIPAIASYLQKVGGDNGASGDLMTRLFSALTFQLTLDIQASDNESRQSACYTVSAEASGTFTLSYLSTNIQGSGTCQYVSGLFVNCDGSLVMSLVPGQSFVENCSLVLNTCPDAGASTATFIFSFFGLLTETWQDSFDPNTTTMSELLDTSSYVFNDHGGPGPWPGENFSFTVPLQNGNAQAVDATIVGQRSGPEAGYENSCTLALTLLHKPN